MRRPHWLLVINLPDERYGSRHEFDHIHSWYETEGEAQTTKRLLEDYFGAHRHHQIIGGIKRVVCPKCGKGFEFYSKAGDSHEPPQEPA